MISFEIYRYLLVNIDFHVLFYAFFLVFGTLFSSLFYQLIVVIGSLI